MKSIFLLIFCLCSVMAFSQQVKEPNYSKKRVFNDFPERVKFKPADLENLLTLKLGAQVNTVISPNVRIAGTVVSKSDDTDPNVKAVVIRLTNREAATFTFTRRKLADGTYTYLGRMMSPHTGDAIDIVKENGQYVMMKKRAHDVFTE